jgi:hypothetical protein
LFRNCSIFLVEQASNILNNYFLLFSSF